MKNFIIILSFVILSTASSPGQSTALVNQIKFDKKDLASNDYTLIHEGGSKTNREWVQEFNQHYFYSGYTYHVIVYLEGCKSCDIGMYFHDLNTDGILEISPTIKSSGGVVQGVLSFNQEYDSHGNLAAYAESNKKVYTYCMLFSKKTH